MKLPLALLVLATATLAGCSGAPDESLTVSHVESSELSRVTIDSEPRSAFTYEHLFIDVGGKRYSFGEFASFDDRRYQVDGKKDPVAMVERGDVLSIVASGQHTILLLKDEDVLATFEANIPDNHVPAAPVLMEPAHKASGVSRRPTFRWSAISDPGGVSYTLVYSVDPSFQAAPLTSKVEKLTATSFTVAGGKELLEGQRYFWRVQAVDSAANASPWSDSAEFLVAGGVLG